MVPKKLKGGNRVMGEFLDNYGRIIVSVIIVLALATFVAATFTPQFQKALTDTLSTFFAKSGATGSLIM